MDRPFDDAFPPGYDPIPVRCAARALIAAASRDDAEAFEQTIWEVAGHGTPGYVLLDLLRRTAELAATPTAA